MREERGRNIREWLQQALVQFEAGVELSEHSAPQIPCYHFRMSVELFLKTLNIVIDELPLGYFDANPTHSIPRLWEKCRAQFNEHSASEELRESAYVFVIHHTDYIYVKYRENLLLTPSDRFGKQDIVKHRTAAQTIGEIVKKYVESSLIETS